MYSTDEAMSNKCEIVLYDVRDYESPIRWVLLESPCDSVLYYALYNYASVGAW